MSTITASRTDNPLTAGQLPRYAPWALGAVALIAGGVIPVLSFVTERQAEGWFAASLPASLDRARALAQRRMDLIRASFYHRQS